jgi:predicted DNA-binding ribbon-helix-helix protein
MKTSIVKRSIIVGDHKTSVSLEDPFWDALKEIASLKNMTLAKLVDQIDVDRGHGNLSSAIRLFVLDQFRSPAPIRDARPKTEASAGSATERQPR